jgi:hypothetical protein
MKNRLSTLAVAALFAMSIVPFPNDASAMPFADGIALKNAAPTNIETVRWRGHRGWGPGVGAGIIGGAILGGMLAAPYYGYGPYYGPGPYAYEPGPYVYGPGYGGNAVAYCMQRFRSYDPGSGTYLGFDGFRHP